jgi:hypothetical protein
VELGVQDMAGIYFLLGKFLASVDKTIPRKAACF